MYEMYFLAIAVMGFLAYLALLLKMRIGPKTKERENVSQAEVDLMIARAEEGDEDAVRWLVRHGYELVEE